MIENYRVDELGVIHQISFTPMRYDREYLSYYEDFNDRTIKLGYQGTGWLPGSLGRIPGSVLEIGYGTGSFIESASITGVIVCAGCDVIHYPLPDAIEYLEWNDALATELGVSRHVRRFGRHFRAQFSISSENYLI